MNKFCKILYNLFFFLNKFQQLMKSCYKKKRMSMLSGKYTVLVAICTLLWTLMRTRRSCTKL